MKNIEQKIHDSLSELSFQLGQHDYATSMHDTSESYYEKNEVIFAGHILVELINEEEDFISYIENNTNLIEQYMLGYVENFETYEKLPADINEGRVGSISITLTEEQQEQIRQMIAIKK